MEFKGSTKAGGVGLGSYRSQREKPSRVLPTDRIAFSKQLDILRAYAIVSGLSGKRVTNDEVSRTVKMAASTVSLANTFFSDIGLIQKSEGGYVPSMDVINFTRAYESTPSVAAHRLSPTLEKSWFFQLLSTRLDLRSLPQDEALEILGEEITSERDYSTQLTLLLDYLDASGLIIRDGAIIKSRNRDQKRASVERPLQSITDSSGSLPLNSTKAADGGIEFSFSVKLTVDEISTWGPDRIAALFGGIAQILSAKNRE
jgi:hypothetical protein